MSTAVVYVGVYCTSKYSPFISRVISHDIRIEQAVVVDDSGNKLLVNTAKIEPYGFTLGLCYNFIGDIIKNEDLSMALKVRTVTCIKQLDIEMFVKALELRRNFLISKCL